MTDPKYEQIARGNEDLRNSMDGSFDEPMVRSNENDDNHHCDGNCENCNCNKKEGK